MILLGGVLLIALDAAEPDSLKQLIGQVRAFESALPAFDDTAAILLTLTDA